MVTVAIPVFLFNADPEIGKGTIRIQVQTLKKLWKLFFFYINNSLIGDLFLVEKLSASEVFLKIHRARYQDQFTYR